MPHYAALKDACKRSLYQSVLQGPASGHESLQDILVGPQRANCEVAVSPWPSGLSRKPLPGIVTPCNTVGAVLHRWTPTV